MAPNPIDFSVVLARLPDIANNFAVLATICSIFALYFLCLIYARRADKKDHAKVRISISISISTKHLRVCVPEFAVLAYFLVCVCVCVYVCGARAR